MSQGRPYEQRFHVAFDYPVIFTRDLFSAGNAVLRDALCRLDEGRRHRALVFVDGGLHAARPGLLQDVLNYFRAHAADIELVKPPHVVPGGEVIKNDYRLTMEIVDTILEYGLCRHSYVIAVGGGAVLDAVGFAASIVHRGLRTVRVPTTTLSQNDGGVGVKNGMNLHGGKNTIGTFHPPFAVLNDFALLDSLPFEHWIGGVSEAFKVAMIKDAAFFRDLCRDAARYRERDITAMERLIEHCAKLHLDHIRENGDPFELGRARPLDFGHWSAHKLESMSGYRISHGEAVATGLGIDSLYAVAQGWLDAADADALIHGLMECGFTLWHPEMERRLGDGTLELLGGLDDFQEHLGGGLCVTFPNGLGRKHEVHEIDREAMARAIAEIQPRITQISRM